MSSAEVVDRIESELSARPAPPGVRTKVVAVDGPGGAGKSTLARALADRLGASVLQTDDFASWDDPLGWWPRLLAEALEPLARGERARFRRTDWSGEGRELWREVEPAPVVILEGVSASRDAFRPYLTYAIWVDTPREERLRRGLDRDGPGARADWERWMAEEDVYVARERPDERADLVVAGS